MMMTGDESDWSVADTSPRCSSKCSSRLPGVRRQRSTSSPATSSMTAGNEQRALLRPWLMTMADEKLIEGLEWIDPVRRTHLKIPWRHASRSEWSEIDSKLFRAWAEHKGRSGSTESNARSLKRNFRCALNSLRNGRVVEDESCRNGSNAYIIYEFLSELPEGQSDHPPAIVRSNGDEISETSHISCFAHGLDDTISNFVLGDDSIQPPSGAESSASSFLPSVAGVAAMSGFASRTIDGQLDQMPFKNHGPPTSLHLAVESHSNGSVCGPSLPTCASFYGKRPSTTSTANTTTPDRLLKHVVYPATSSVDSSLSAYCGSNFAQLTSPDSSPLPPSQEHSTCAVDIEDILQNLDSILDTDQIISSRNVLT